MKSEIITENEEESHQDVYTYGKLARDLHNESGSMNSEVKVSKLFTKSLVLYEIAVRCFLLIIILVTQFIPANKDWIIQLEDMSYYAYPIRRSINFIWLMIVSIVICCIVPIPSVKLYQRRLDNSNTTIDANDVHKVYGINQHLLKQELTAYTLALTLAITLNMSVTNVIKICFGVPRPDYLNRCFPHKYEDNMVKYNRPYIPDSINFQCEQSHASSIDPFNVEARKSFPSGHCAMIMAMSYVANWYIWNRAYSSTKVGPGVRVIGYFVGYLPTVIIASERIRAHRHHATDVIAGVIIGLVSGYISIVSYFHKVNRISSCPLGKPLIQIQDAK